MSFSRARRARCGRLDGACRMHQTEDINSVVTSPRRGLPGPLPVRTNLLRLESFAWIVRLAIYRIPVYDKLMFESFRDAETEKIFQQQPSKQFRAIEKTVLRKLMHRSEEERRVGKECRSRWSP